MDYIAYLCDRKQCENCSYPTCRHTTDISHAVNFEQCGNTNRYIEKEPEEDNDDNHN